MTSSIRPSSQMSPSSSRFGTVAREVLAGETTPVGLFESLGIAVDTAGHAGPRCGDDEIAAFAVPTELPSLSTMSALMPGNGVIAAPGFVP